MEGGGFFIKAAFCIGLGGPVLGCEGDVESVVKGREKLLLIGRAPKIDLRMSALPVTGWRVSACTS